MIAYRIFEDECIVIIEPSGRITRSDLDALTRDVDSYIRQRGTIPGMIIETRSFPRWHDLSAFLKDMIFVFAHQRKIQRVASVTDSRLLFIVHRIAHHVLSPDIGHFSYGDKEAALQWIRKSADRKAGENNLRQI